jgi:hypothetical protein
VQKSVLLRELQKELQRHDLSTFVDDPPSAAQGGKGVTVPGCPCCRKRFGTIAQFLDHLISLVHPRQQDESRLLSEMLVGIKWAQSASPSMAWDLCWFFGRFLRFGCFLCLWFSFLDIVTAQNSFVGFL